MINGCLAGGRLIHLCQGWKFQCSDQDYCDKLFKKRVVRSAEAKPRCRFSRSRLDFHILFSQRRDLLKIHINRLSEQLAKKLCLLYVIQFGGINLCAYVIIKVMEQGTLTNDSFNTSATASVRRTSRYVLEPFGMTVIRLILFGVIFLAAVIGNFFVFTASFRNRRLRTFSYCLIMNLAISDLISILGVPFLLVNEQLQPTWIYGTFLCRFINPTQVACGLVTTNVHVAIAIDRYFSIVRPFRHSSFRRRRFVVVSGIWLVAVGCSLPAYIFRELFTLVSKSGVKMEFCIERFPPMGEVKYGWRHVYSVFLFFINYLLPISVSTVLYGHIFLSLKKTELERKRFVRKISQSSSNRGEVKDSKDDNNSTYLERRFIFMAIVIVVIFIFCYLPYQVVFLLSEFNYGVKWPYFRILLSIVYFFTWLPNALNPICYGAMDQRYARAFRKICLSCRQETSSKAGSRTGSLSRGQSRRLTEQEV